MYFIPVMAKLNFQLHFLQSFMLIWFSIIISYYYQCWKQLWRLIFLWKSHF